MVTVLFFKSEGLICCPSGRKKKKQFIIISRQSHSGEKIFCGPNLWQGFSPPVMSQTALRRVAYEGFFYNMYSSVTLSQQVVSL